MISKQRCLDLIEDLLGIIGIAAMEESRRLLNSGGIDLTSYENNYLAPKVILSVALKNILSQYSPSSFNVHAVEDCQNLQHF